MKALIGVGLGVLFVTGIWGQSRWGFVNPQPFVQGSFGNAVFPGGTSAMPGITRSFGNAAFPSGAGFPRLIVPGTITDPTFLARPGSAGSGLGRQFGRGGGGRRGNNAVVLPYAVPVYVGGFYDNPYVGDGAPAPPPQPQQPSVIVVYPQVQQPVVYSPPADNLAPGPADAGQPTAEAAPAEPQQYLIAFKDHTIYAALAYWVDGDTLHYFTSGNTHNQVSLSLVDKAMTERLNKEAGIDLRLP